MQLNWEGGDASSLSVCQPVCLSVCLTVRGVSAAALCLENLAVFRASEAEVNTVWDGSPVIPVIPDHSFDETAELHGRVLCYTSLLSSAGCFR